MLRGTASALSLVVLTGCGLSLPAPASTVTVTREAPPSAFRETTTFELEPSFEPWATDGEPQKSEQLGHWKSDLERGASRAEHEFKRDSFLTNPRLANRSAPPGYKLRIAVEETDRRRPRLEAQATLRIVDPAGTVIEEVGILASADKSQGPSGVAEDLGYRVALYMVCRTGGKPAAACSY